jgi:hypothetical protein
MRRLSPQRSNYLRPLEAGAIFFCAQSTGRWTLRGQIAHRNEPNVYALSKWQTGKSRLQCAGCRPRPILPSAPNPEDGRGHNINSH